MRSPPRLGVNPGAAPSARGRGPASLRPAALPASPGGKELSCSHRPLGCGWRRVSGNLTPFSARLLAFTPSPGVSRTLQAEPAPGAVPPWETRASPGGHHLPAPSQFLGSSLTPSSVEFQTGFPLPDMSTLTPLLPFPATLLSFPFLAKEPLSPVFSTSVVPDGFSSWAEFAGGVNGKPPEMLFFS